LLQSELTQPIRTTRKRKRNFTNKKKESKEEREDSGIRSSSEDDKVTQPIRTTRKRKRRNFTNKKKESKEEREDSGISSSEDDKEQKKISRKSQTVHPQKKQWNAKSRKKLPKKKDLTLAHNFDVAASLGTLQFLNDQALLEVSYRLCELFYEERL
jgi:hypothetical protein